MTAGPVKPRKRTPRARPKRSGQFHHGDLAEQLAVAATALVEKEGHQALSLKKLAAQLGVTDPAIYRHYPSRDALLAEVAIRGFLRMLDAQVAAQAGVADAFESIRAFSRTYVRFAAQNPGWFRLQFSRASSEGLLKLSGVWERFAPAEAARQELLTVWRAAMPSSGGDDVANLYRLVWGTSHGLASFVVERVFQLVETDEERIAAADVAIDMMVSSLRARRDARARQG